MTENPFDPDNAPTNEPRFILAGQFVHWRRNVVLEAGVTLEYRVAPVTGLTGNLSPVTITGTVDADGTYFALTGVTTGAFDAGEKRWSLVTKRTSDGEIIEVENGTWRVFTSTSDRRTHAEVMLQKIESLLAGRADHDVSSYSINNRSLDRMSVKELLDWRDYYRNEVSLTGGASTTTSTKPRNKLQIRFGG